jgi:hypothetical protein
MELTMKTTRKICGVLVLTGGFALGVLGGCQYGGSGGVDSSHGDGRASTTQSKPRANPNATASRGNKGSGSAAGTPASLNPTDANARKATP